MAPEHRGLPAVLASMATNLLKVWNQAVMPASLDTIVQVVVCGQHASLGNIATKCRERIPHIVKFVNRARMETNWQLALVKFASLGDIEKKLK